MTDELTKETIRQEALESWDIGADTGKFYARVVQSLMHNKIKIEDLPLDLMKGFRLSQKLQLKIGKKMTKDIDEKLYMDLLDLCEKYSDEMGVPDFAHFVTSFIANMCMDCAPNEMSGILMMLDAITDSGLKYKRDADDWRNDV